MRGAQGDKQAHDRGEEEAHEWIGGVSRFASVVYVGTLSRVSNYPYLYILYSTLRYELWNIWKLERVALRVALATVPGTRELLDGR